MFKMFIAVTCGLLLSCLVSDAISADVKVMRSKTLIGGGEECFLIGEMDAFGLTLENSDKAYSKAVTLKQMIGEGWKIAYVKDFSSRYSTEFLFIFVK